jgi:hypothetical protein
VRLQQFNNMLLLLLLVLFDASIIHPAFGFWMVSPTTALLPIPGRPASHRLRCWRTFRSNNGHNVNDDDEVDDRDGTRRRRIHDLIDRMSEFYVDMVDHNSDHCRFYATCVPSTGVQSHHDDDDDDDAKTKKKNIIRDLAAAWDASKLLLFDQNHSGDRQEDIDRLRRAMANTVEHYQAALVPIVVATLPGMTSTTRPAARNIKAGLRLSSDQEASSIGHSALMILAAIGYCKVLHQQSSSSSSEQTTTTNGIMELSKIIEGLAWGILSQQRADDGAFRIAFDRHDDEDDETNVYKGIEFYPGEAMVALAEVYDCWPSLQQHMPPEQLFGSAAATSMIQTAIRRALPRALRFYSDYFYHNGTAVDANYSIWQIQAAARLFHLSKRGDWNQPSPSQIPTTTTTTDRPRSDDYGDDLSQPEQPMDVAAYVMDLCETIVTSNAWRHHLARGPSFYGNLQTIEIACGLDAIGDAISIIRIIFDAEVKAAAAAATHAGAESGDGRPKRIMTLLRQRIDDALRFFEWTLDNVPAQAPLGHGGLGMGGTVVREQRLDVTGHAASALIKLHALSSTSSSTNAHAP